MPGELYIYFYRKNQAVCIPLGKMESRNGALEWHGCMEADNILGKGICFEETRGIRVCRPGGRDYVAEWDDYPVDPARFVLYPKGWYQVHPAARGSEIVTGVMRTMLTEEEKYMREATGRRRSRKA